MIALTDKFWTQHTSKNLARLRGRVARALRIKPPDPPSTWCQEKLKLSLEVEADQHFDMTNRPWWREVLDTLIDPEVRYVTIPAATQVGKTLSLVAMMIWCAVHAPAPAMVVTPDRDSAIELRDRVYANALESPQLRNLVPPKKSWNSRWIDLGTMRIYLAWSGSRQRLRGRRCKYVFLTETDAYRGDKKTGDPISAAEERTKAFFRFYVFRESSPVEDPSPIATLEAESDDRRRWHAKCPHCGLYQELRFFTHREGKRAGKGGIGGWKDDEDKLRTPSEARDHAHYICEAGCRIDEDQRLEFITNGRTVSRGQRVEKNGRVVGEPAKSQRSIGLHLWTIHSEKKTFGDLAAAYLEHRANGKLPEFYGNWLGMSFKSNSKLPTWQQLARRLSWTNMIKEVPAECWFLTGGGDVQHDRVKYAVRGWAPGCTSFQVDCGELERAAGDENDMVKSDLAQIERAILGRTYNVVGPGGKNPLGKTELSVRMFGLDSGDRTIECYQWWNSLPDAWTDDETGRVRLFKGSHHVDPSERWRQSDITESRDGTTKYENAISLWLVYVYLFYADLIERLQGQSNKPGAWHVAKDAISINQQYLKEVVNFHRIVKIINGHRKREWRPISESIPNDFWDAEIYALICAHMVVGDLGWTEEAWDHQWRRKQERRRRTSRKRSHVPSIADR